MELAATWADEGGGDEVGSSCINVVSKDIASLGGGRFGFICSLSESFMIFIASASSDVHTTKK